MESRVKNSYIEEGYELTPTMNSRSGGDLTTRCAMRAGTTAFTVMHNQALADMAPGISKDDIKKYGYWPITKHMVRQILPESRDLTSEGAIYISGHSQGGARASLVSMWLEKADNKKYQTYALSPVGCQCFSRKLSFLPGSSNGHNLLADVDPYINHDQITGKLKASTLASVLNRRSFFLLRSPSQLCQRRETALAALVLPYFTPPLPVPKPFLTPPTSYLASLAAAYLHPFDFYALMDYQVGNVCKYGTSRLNTPLEGGTNDLMPYVESTIGYTGPELMVDMFDDKAPQAFQMTRHWTHSIIWMNVLFSNSSMLDGQGVTDGGCVPEVLIPASDPNSLCPDGDSDAACNALFLGVGLTVFLLIVGVPVCLCACTHTCCFKRSKVDNKTVFERTVRPAAVKTARTIREKTMGESKVAPD